jgi:hypothetical protein
LSVCGDVCFQLFTFPAMLYWWGMVNDDPLISAAEATLAAATRPARRQGSNGLGPLEEFFLGILRSGTIPNSKPERPELVSTARLLLAAREHWYLRGLSGVALGQFLRNQGLLRYRQAHSNSWVFPPLAVARANWEKRHGKHSWPAFPREWRRALSYIYSTNRDEHNEVVVEGVEVAPSGYKVW